MSELTRAEAIERAQLIDVQRYVVDLDLPACGDVNAGREVLGTADRRRGPRVAALAGRYGFPCMVPPEGVEAMRTHPDRQALNRTEPRAVVSRTDRLNFPTPR